MIEKLKQIFGPNCTAISVNREISEFINVPSAKMKFCEAVGYSFKIPIRLNNENISCPGARHSIGFHSNSRQLEKIISENNNIPVLFIRTIPGTISQLHNIKHINLGLTSSMEKENTPDLYIVYVKPSSITTIMYNLAKMPYAFLCLLSLFYQFAGMFSLIVMRTRQFVFLLDVPSQENLGV